MFQDIGFEGRDWSGLELFTLRVGPLSPLIRMYTQVRALLLFWFGNVTGFDCYEHRHVDFEDG